jgi:crossover junction endodeoxyribonuclease RuvC
MRILGVDPGSRFTGYGCVDVIGRQIRHVAHGTLKLTSASEKVSIPLEDRLLLLYEGLSEVIQRLKPQVMAVEKVFFAKNAVSALKLGQARGAAILTGKIHSLVISEYNPTEVKQVVAGYGQADKEQVARVVQLILGKQKFDTFDASDGLALAICHALFFGRCDGKQSASNLSLQAISGKRKKKRFSLAESVGASLPKKV